MADHCTPETFDDGRLVVRTDSTAWATQLQLLAPTVVRRLNEELGHGTVTLIEVLGPHLPSWTKGRLFEPRRARAARHLRLSLVLPIWEPPDRMGAHRPPCSTARPAFMGPLSTFSF